MADNNAQTKKTPIKVFNIRERGEGEDPSWFRIGVAFRNKNGSLTVLLDALPIDGKLYIKTGNSEPDGE